ncbi:MAG: glycosyltransferase family 39 protein [Chloroflexi bacterium]|nr:glycosyltransferase family 39 protein [Chloroflexota bacterium]
MRQAATQDSYLTAWFRRGKGGGSVHRRGERPFAPTRRESRPLICPTTVNPSLNRDPRAETGRWLVAPALALGLVLRLLDLGGRNTWYDEISSILFAEKDLATIVRATAADTMPPLYYFLLHFWLLLGNNLWVARSLSVLLSVGTIVVAFAIGRRLFGARVALIASLLVALNPFQIYYGQEVRMYSLLALSQLLAIYFLLRCLDSSSFGNWTGFALSQSVAMYTHNAAFLSLATLDVLALGIWWLFHVRHAATRSGLTEQVTASTDIQRINGWMQAGYQVIRCSNPMTPSPRGLSSLVGPSVEGRSVPLIKDLILANLSIAVLFLPWLFYLPGQLAKVTRAFWTQTPGVAEVVRSIVVFTFNLPSPTPWSFPILLAVSLLLSALVVYSIGKAVRPAGREFQALLFFATVCFSAPIVLAVLVSLVRPIYVERVLIAPSILYLILLAWAAERLRPRFMAPVLLVPVILVSAWSLLAYYQYDGFPRVAFPRVVDSLKDSVQAGDVIVHDNKLTFFPAYYLRRDLPQRFLPDPDWSMNDTLAGQTQDALGLRASALAEAVEGKSRVWFVVFEKSLTEAREQGRANENVEWLDSRLQLASKQSFGDLSVYLYTRISNP